MGLGNHRSSVPASWPAFAMLTLLAVADAPASHQGGRGFKSHRPDSTPPYGGVVVVTAVFVAATRLRLVAYRSNPTGAHPR